MTEMQIKMQQMISNEELDRAFDVRFQMKCGKNYGEQRWR